MYNLFISGHQEAWSDGKYELDASRYLEYTITNITEKLSPLASNIDFLLKLPCLFAYEGSETPYRFGWLTNIEDRGSRIYLEYKFDKKIPPIPFKKIELLADELDIRHWEINRTHWAVKNGNLWDILELEESDFSRERFSNKKFQTGKSPTLGEISTVRGFLLKIFNLEKPNNCEVFYRGHSDGENYKLKPSLFRKDSRGNYLYLQNEDILYKELLVSNSLDFQGDIYTLDRLVRMQHYSLPTRMLDITSNPLISLYFACITPKDMKNIGEVIIFTINSSFIKYFDSDTASCIANLARLPQMEKNSIDYLEEQFNEQKSVKRLLHLIKEEKPYFTPNIISTDLKKVICVKSKMTNNRIVSQSGAFLLFGHDAVMNESGIDGIKIERISITDKEKILEELDSLNINERTVFPYIENSAKYIKNKYKVKY